MGSEFHMSCLSISARIYSFQSDPSLLQLSVVSLLHTIVFLCIDLYCLVLAIIGKDRLGYWFTTL